MGSDYQTAGAWNPRTLPSRFNDWYPSTLATINAGIPSTASAQLRGANEQVNPTDPSLMGLNALNLDQLQRYALPEAQVGQQVANSNALAGARTNLAQISGPGGDAARAASALTTELNPTLTAAEKAARDQLGAINLTGLSPGEANAVERGTNQYKTSTGNLGLVNGTNIIGDALNFGGAFNSKLGLLNNATNTANSVAGTRLAAFNPTNVALGQPNQSTATNFGAGQFQNTTPLSAAGPASNAFGFGSNLYSGLVGANSSAQSAGAAMAGQSSPAAILGAV